MRKLMVLLLLCGCFPPKPQPIAPVVEDNEPKEVVELPPLTVSMPESLLATLYEVLGDQGTVTFERAKPLKIVRPDTSITFPARSSFRYVLDTKRGMLTFPDPKPLIEARAAGLRFTPHLSRIELLADNTGFAIVEGALYTKKQAFDLRTIGEPETIEAKTTQDEKPVEPIVPEVDPFVPPHETKTDPVDTSAEATEQTVPMVEAVDNRPVVILYTAEWCKNCRQPRMEFLAGMPLTANQINDMWLRNLEFTTADSLPFRVVIRTEFPQYVTAIPALHWESKDGGGKLQQGWSGLGEFLRVWESTR